MGAAHPTLAFPGDHERIVETRRRLYLEPLEFPSAVLLYTSGLTVAAFAGHVLFWAWETYRGDEALAREFSLTLAQWHIWLPVILLNSFVFFAAIQMYRGRQYWVCVAGAILAIVPLPPFFILSVPFGLWSLYLLCKEEVRVAFVPPIASKK